MMNVPYLDKLGLAHFLQRLKGEIVTDAETDADDKPVAASVAKQLNENKSGQEKSYRN